MDKIDFFSADFRDGRVTVGGKTRYACVEGPDFDGHEVDFDELMHRNGTYKEREAECRMMKLADKA